jgi:hypothetical protein
MSRLLTPTEKHFVHGSPFTVWSSPQRRRGREGKRGTPQLLNSFAELLPDKQIYNILFDML